jgi:aldehyde:ferredoxin oxidoreductase
MKIMRVDLSTQEISVEDMPSGYQGLGGRALTSVLVAKEVNPRCEPLGSGNKLVFAPGLLSGTGLVNTSRLSVGSKSPLTGGIKESNVGGTVSAALGRMGLGAVVVEGQSPKGDLFVLRIQDDETASLIPAREYKGARTYALCEALLEKFGKKNAVVYIGPAGELKLASASIQSSDVDKRPCRAAGRGGLGAAMGAKGLKALVVGEHGKAGVQMTNSSDFAKAAKDFANALRTHPYSGKAMPNLGTAMLVAPINAAGAFPSFNARKGVFEGWEKISGENLAGIIRKRGGNPSHRGCAQCIIHCSNVFVDDSSRYVTSSLEYETIWAMGAMCGIDDLDTIARLDFACDDIGLDTINTGVAIAVAMDAGYCRFGDGQTAERLIEEVAKGSEIGRAIGEGPVAVGRMFDHPRVPVAKRQSIAAYDPRAIQGMAVTYATSPMGADHTAGWVVGKNLSAFGGTLDPLSPHGQVEVSREFQIFAAAFDSTGLCTFASPAANDVPGAREALLQMIGLRVGREFEWEDMIALGKRVIKAERDFNRRSGMTASDDRLAPMFYQEPLPPHNKTVLVTDEEMDSTFRFLDEE